MVSDKPTRPELLPSDTYEPIVDVEIRHKIEHNGYFWSANLRGRNWAGEQGFAGKSRKRAQRAALRAARKLLDAYAAAPDHRIERFVVTLDDRRLVEP